VTVSPVFGVVFVPTFVTVVDLVAAAVNAAMEVVVVNAFAGVLMDGLIVLFVVAVPVVMVT
jgi:hypothetical protein